MQIDSEKHDYNRLKIVDLDPLIHARTGNKLTNYINWWLKESKDLFKSARKGYTWIRLTPTTFSMLLKANEVLEDTWKSLDDTLLYSLEEYMEGKDE